MKRVCLTGFIIVFCTGRLFSQVPKLMLPIGHSGVISSAAFSPDGEYAVTASWDKTARIWQTGTGTLIAILKGHTGFLNDVQFSPDGKYIVTASSDKTARLWDAATGSLLAVLEGHNDEVEDAGFSPDGSLIMTTAFDETRIWDARTLKPLHTLRGHANGMGRTCFSPDGKSLLTIQFDVVLIWDPLKGIQERMLRGHSDGINGACFSLDGRSILTASSDGTARIWDRASGEERFILRIPGAENAFQPDKVIAASYSPNGKYVVTASSDGVPRIWNTVDGTLFSTLGPQPGLTQALFSHDSKRILTASDGADTACIWEAATGALQVVLRGHTNGIWDASYSPNGQFILTSSSDHTARIWNAGSGTALAALTGHTEWIRYAVFSPDGKSMLTWSVDGLTRTWETETGRLLHVLSVQGNRGMGWSLTAGFGTARYSADGAWILTRSLDSTVRIWNAQSGMLQGILPKQQSEILGAEFSADGEYLVTRSDFEARVWNARTASLLSVLKGHEQALNDPCFSPDGRYIVTTSKDHTAGLWEAVSGKLLTILQGHEGPVLTAIFSPDGNTIVTSSEDKTARVWTRDNNDPIAVLEGHTSWVTGASFSPDGKSLLTLSMDGTARLWNTDGWKLQAVLAGHNDWVRRCSFSPDGNTIITSSMDGTARLWNARNGGPLGILPLVGTNEWCDVDWRTGRILSDDGAALTLQDLQTGRTLYTFFSVDSSDYLVHDAANRYDGTMAARNRLYFTCNREVIGLDQVKDRLWVPKLAERIMKGDSINASRLSDLDICGLTPEVKQVQAPAGTYLFRIRPGRGGLGETVLCINNIETLRFPKNALAVKDGMFELAVNAETLQGYFTPDTENRVRVKAFTADNSISSRGGIVVVNRQEQQATPPDLYAVMVGVSEYKGEALRLKYAAKDASDLSGALATSARKLLNGDGREHVFTYDLTTAATRYRYPEKKAVQQVLAEIGKKAKANDILLIFFAGHGVMGGDGDKKQFYFLTADASSLTATDAVKDVGISMSELTQWIDPARLKAQKRVLIFDACNSGQAIRDIAGKDLAVRNDDRVQRIRAIDKLNERSGLFILSAAASDQSAYEMGRYAQGLLTYSLLRAIRQRPDILEEGRYLNLSRWFQAAVESVSDLSRDNGARQDPQIVSNTNFNIGVVDAEVMAGIVLPKERPIFSSSLFINSDESVSDDDLEMSRQIDQQLRDRASRGSGTPIEFVNSAEGLDAWSLSGRYAQKGDSITIKVNLKYKKEVRQRFEVTGSKRKLSELAATVAERSVGMAN